MAARNTSPISIDTKKAIFAMRVKGFGNKQIGEKFGVHPVTISRVCSAVRKAEAKPVAPNSAPDDATILANWRDRLKVKSIQSVERALDDGSDNYKAGTLGAACLKGLGEFGGDISVTVNNMLSGVPPEWRDELVRCFDGNGETQPASGMRFIETAAGLICSVPDTGGESKK